jgi:hypothetical protein
MDRKEYLEKKNDLQKQNNEKGLNLSGFDALFLSILFL